MRSSLHLVAAAIVGGTFLGFGCTSPAPKGEADRATLASETMAAMDAFKNDDPSLQELIDKSVGHAVFPEVGKAGFIAGGSYGQGEVFEGAQKIGYADITQATVGLQAGAQTFGELILFMRPEDLSSFKENRFSLAGNISAVALREGAARSVDTTQGVVVFVRTKKGAMAEASVGGQRFRFRPLAAPAATQPSQRT
jgi:lipid-binding SYLF domain-containing protein